MLAKKSLIAVLAILSVAAGSAFAQTKASIDTVFAQGEPNPYGKYFTGQSYLTMLSENDSTFNAPIGNVTFEPKSRTFWHKHTWRSDPFGDFR